MMVKDSEGALALTESKYLRYAARHLIAPTRLRTRRGIQGPDPVTCGSDQRQWFGHTRMWMERCYMSQEALGVKADGTLSDSGGSRETWEWYAAADLQNFRSGNQLRVLQTLFRVAIS